MSLKNTYDEIALQLKESIQDSLLTSTGAYGAPLASGKLLASIDVKPDGKGGFDIYAEDYATFIENGRKPSSKQSKGVRTAGEPLAPPLQPILQWVQQKRIGGSNPIGVAYAIQNSLRYKNIKPRPFIERGIEAVAEQSLDDLAFGIEESLDKAFQ
jgi:hypothetical protein